MRKAHVLARSLLLLLLLLFALPAAAQQAQRPLGTLREQGVAATRQLAKRQLTWLRSWQEAKHFDCLDDSVLEQISAYIEVQLGR